ncbi:MAG: hypothetical protein ACYTX0_00435 [Nostoc sp.]
MLQVGGAGRQSPQVEKPAHGAGSLTHWLGYTRLYLPPQVKNI